MAPLAPVGALRDRVARLTDDEFYELLDLALLPYGHPDRERGIAALVGADWKRLPYEQGDSGEP